MCIIFQSFFRCKIQGSGLPQKEPISPLNVCINQDHAADLQKQKMVHSPSVETDISLFTSKGRTANGNIPVTSGNSGIF